MKTVSRRACECSSVTSAFQVPGGIDLIALAKPGSRQLHTPWDSWGVGVGADLESSSVVWCDVVGGGRCVAPTHSRATPKRSDPSLGSALEAMAVVDTVYSRSFSKALRGIGDGTRGQVSVLRRLRNGGKYG